MPSKRKSSARVTLVLAGVAALAGCHREPEARRDVYASREDCLADWGHKPEDCTAATDRPRQGGGGGGFFFYGPMYAASAMNAMRSSAWSGSGARPGSHAVDSSPASSGSVSRGGFGSTGRASSSGG
jgi:uncharacterized protein YgiB involved in biofilm formation